MKRFVWGLVIVAALILIVYPRSHGHSFENIARYKCHRNLERMRETISLYKLEWRQNLQSYSTSSVSSKLCELMGKNSYRFICYADEFDYPVSHMDSSDEDFRLPYTSYLFPVKNHDWEISTIPVPVICDIVGLHKNVNVLVSDMSIRYPELDEDSHEFKLGDQTYQFVIKDGQTLGLRDESGHMILAR